MEHAIGTKITLEVVKTTLEVVESKDDRCDGCYFDHFCNKPKDWICYSQERTDHKNIIYKEVKEDRI